VPQVGGSLDLHPVAQLLLNPSGGVEVHLVTDDLGQTQDLDKMCDLGGGAEDDAGRRTHFFQQQRGYFTEFVLSSSCHEPSFSVPQRRSSSSLSGMMSRAPFFSGIWSR